MAIQESRIYMGYFYIFFILTSFIACKQLRKDLFSGRFQLAVCITQMLGSKGTVLSSRAGG